MLVAVPYLLIVCFCANLLAAGGPGVLNLVVLGAGYNALRFVLMGPWSLVLLVRVRLQEAAGRRRARTSRDGGDTMDAFLAHASR